MTLFFVVFGCVLFLAGCEGKEVCFETETTIGYCESPNWCCSDNRACCGLPIQAWVGIAIGGLAVIVLIGVGIVYLAKKANNPCMTIHPQGCARKKSDSDISSSDTDLDIANDNTDTTVVIAADRTDTASDIVDDNTDRALSVANNSENTAVVVPNGNSDTDVVIANDSTDTTVVIADDRTDTTSDIADNNTDRALEIEKDTFEVETDMEIYQTSKRDDKKHPDSTDQETRVYVVTVPGAPMDQDDKSSRVTNPPQGHEVNQVLEDKVETQKESLPAAEKKPSTNDNVTLEDSVVVFVEKSKHDNPPSVDKRKVSNSPIYVKPEENKDDRSTSSSSFSFMIDCVPCFELANDRKEATGFCKECNDPLCDFCVKQHKRLRDLETHEVIEFKCAQCLFAKIERTPSGFCFDCHEFLCESCVGEHNVNKASRNHNIHENIKTLNLDPFHLPEPINNKVENPVRPTENSRKRKLLTTKGKSSSYSSSPNYEMTDGSSEEEDDLD